MGGWLPDEALVLSYRRGPDGLEINGEASGWWPTKLQLEYYRSLTSFEGLSRATAHDRDSRAELFDRLFWPVIQNGVLPPALFVHSTDAAVEQLPFEATSAPIIGRMVSDDVTVPLVNEVDLIRCYEAPHGSVFDPDSPEPKLYLLTPNPVPEELTWVVDLTRRDLDLFADASDGWIVETALDATMVQVIAHGEPPSDRYRWGRVQFPDARPAETIVDMICPAEAPPPAFVMLLICDGANARQGDHMAKLLMERGVGAVIAARAPLGLTDSRVFSRAFWREFASGCDLSTAVRVARDKMRRDGGQPMHHATLGLYSNRLDHSNPWAVEQPPPPHLPVQPLPPLEANAHAAYLATRASRIDWLIDPHARLTPLIGHDTELNELPSWLASEIPLRIMLVTGDPGCGATRFAAGVVHVARTAGWEGGFLATDGNLDRLVNDVVSSAHGDVCVVIDDAEQLSASVDDLVRRLLGRGWPDATRVRLVIVAHQGRNTAIQPDEWFETLTKWDRWTIRVEHDPAHLAAIAQAYHHAFDNLLGGPPTDAHPPTEQTTPGAFGAVMAAAATWRGRSEAGAVAQAALDSWAVRAHLPSSLRPTTRRLIASACTLRPFAIDRLVHLSQIDPAPALDTRTRRAFVELLKSPARALGGQWIAEEIALTELRRPGVLAAWLDEAEGAELRELLRVVAILLAGPATSEDATVQLLGDQLRQLVTHALDDTQLLAPLAQLIAAHDDWGPVALSAAFDQLPVPFQPEHHPLLIALAAAVVTELGRGDQPPRSSLTAEVMLSLVCYGELLAQLDRGARATEAIRHAIQLGEFLWDKGEITSGQVYRLARAALTCGLATNVVALAELALFDSPTAGKNLHHRSLLASILTATGRYQDALPLFEETYRSCIQTLGERHPDTLTSLNNLASIYRAVGRLDDATGLFEEGYRLRVEVLGERHPNTLGSLNNLASIYESVGRLDDAVGLFEEGYRLRVEVLGERHPNTLTSLNNLASIYRAVGRLDDAAGLYEEGYRLCVEVLGERHPDTLTSLNNLASIYRAVGRLDDAAGLYEEAYGLRVEVLGERHPDTLGSLNNLAYIYEAVGRLDDAVGLYEEGYRLRVEVLGERHPNTLTSLNNLASIYESVGRLDDAVGLYEEAYRLRVEVLGERHPDTLTSLNNLAYIYRAVGRLDDAAGLFEEAYRLFVEVLGERHPNTLTSLNNLASIYESVGRLDDAVGLFEEAYRLCVEVLGERHPNTLTSLNNLASIYESVGRLDDAVGLYEDAYRLRVEVLGERHPDTLTSLNNLASIYESVGRFDDAVGLYEEAYRLCVEVLGEAHHLTSTVLAGLQSLEAEIREVRGG